MENPFVGIKVEFHILQSFPVTCLNRDDVGSPKTAVVGGVTRARVSSQCWKRQVRLALHDLGVTLGVRSKNVAGPVSEACTALGADEQKASECGKAVEKALVKETLMFITRSEVAAAAEYAQSLEFDAQKIKDTEVRKLLKKSIKMAVDGLDVALFGRMVALAPELNVEAAAAFSHAISTHAVGNDIDFFTALDDLEVGQQSAHMGSSEFSSATYYRYVSLDMGQLYDSLGGQGLGRAVSAFVKALFVAVPSGKQNTFSGACPWDYAKVLIRKGQRVQLSFDQPVRAGNEGYLLPSIQALNDGLQAQENGFGSLYGKQEEFEISLHDANSMSIDDLASKLEAIYG